MLQKNKSFTFWIPFLFFVFIYLFCLAILLSVKYEKSWFIDAIWLYFIMFHSSNLISSLHLHTLHPPSSLYDCITQWVYCLEDFNYFWYRRNWYISLDIKLYWICIVELLLRRIFRYYFDLTLDITLTFSLSHLPVIRGLVQIAVSPCKHTCCVLQLSACCSQM